MSNQFVLCSILRKLKGRCATDQELNGQEVWSIVALRYWGGVRVRDNLSAAKHDLCFLRPDWGTDLQVSMTTCGPWTLKRLNDLLDKNMILAYTKAYPNPKVAFKFRFTNRVFPSRACIRDAHRFSLRAPGVDREAPPSLH